MGLRLRSNEVAARFLMKPSGLRSFWLCALSLLGHRSMWICSLVASRTKPKILSAAVSIIFYRAVDFGRRVGLLHAVDDPRAAPLFLSRHSFTRIRIA